MGHEVAPIHTVQVALGQPTTEASEYQIYGGSSFLATSCADFALIFTCAICK